MSVLNAAYTDKTCSSCRHWHKMPSDPTNLAAPKIGMCRARPPQVMVVGMMHNGVNVDMVYPRVPEDFPACAMHMEVLELGTVNIART